MSQELDRSDIGAWVLKASPSVWDVNQLIADGEPPPESFRLHETYRLGLIEVGDPVWLWATGSTGGQGPPPRFVASGVVIDLAEEDRGGGPYWVDDDEARKSRPYLPVDLDWLDSPVTVDEIRSNSVLKTFELIRAPRMSNPSYLTPEQDGKLRQLLP